MFRFSCSSSLLGGCDEPEILRYENLKSVPQALTSDTKCNQTLIDFSDELGGSELQCLIADRKEWRCD